MNMDGIIFDVDGTIWDSTDICADSWNEAVNRHTSIKSSLTGDDLKPQFGKPMEEIFFNLFGKQNEKVVSIVAEKCCEYEDRELHALTSKEAEGLCFDGVTDTMRQIAKKKKLFIVSNCQKGYIEVLIEKLNMGDIISDHLCYGDTGTSKGQTILKLMERNGLKNPIYVGDTQGDFEACNEAGIPFVYAAYGFGSPEGFYRKIDSMSDLAALVDEDENTEPAQTDK